MGDSSPSFRRHDDPPAEDWAAARRAPSPPGGYFQGLTEAKLAGLTHAIEQLLKSLAEHRHETADRLQALDAHIMRLRLWKATVLGMGVAASAIISLFVHYLSSLWSGGSSK